MSSIRFALQRPNAMAFLGGTLAMVGSFLEWLTFGHIGPLQVVVSQTGIDLGYGFLSLLSGFGIVGVGLRQTTAIPERRRLVRLALSGVAFASVVLAVLMLTWRPGDTYVEHGPVGSYGMGLFTVLIGAAIAAVASRGHRRSTRAKTV